MPKIYIFASEVNIALIIVKKGNKCSNYQLIKWDMATNTFTEGQWLCNKKLAISCCALSPDGKYFGWVYNCYWKDSSTHAGISMVPNFTANMYSNKCCGTWDTMEFDTSNNPLHLKKYEFVKTDTTYSLPSLIEGDSTCVADCGLKICKKEDSFMNYLGNMITVDDYKVLVNGVVVYDAKNNVFVSKKPIV